MEGSGGGGDGGGAEGDDGGGSFVGEGQRILSHSGLTSTWSVTPPHKLCPDPDAPSHPLARLQASHQRTILLAALLFFSGYSRPCALCKRPLVETLPSPVHAAAGRQPRFRPLVQSFFSQPQKYIQGFFFAGGTEQRFGCTAAVAVAAAASRGLLLLLQTSLHNPCPHPSATEAFLSSDTLEG